MEQFDGPKPEVIRIPIRPVFRDGEVVSVEDLDESEVYTIRVGMLKLKDAMEVESLVMQKLAILVAAFTAPADDGDGVDDVDGVRVRFDVRKLSGMLDAGEMEKLAKMLGGVCELYNGVSDKSGTERWIPLNDENRARAFGGGRMLAFNSWIVQALRVNFADFFAGAGLGLLSKLGVRGLPRR